MAVQQAERQQIIPGRHIDKAEQPFAVTGRGGHQRGAGRGEQLNLNAFDAVFAFLLNTVAVAIQPDAIADAVVQLRRHFPADHARVPAVIDLVGSYGQWACTSGDRVSVRIFVVCTLVDRGEIIILQMFKRQQVAAGCDLGKGIEAVFVCGRFSDQVAARRREQLNLDLGQPVFAFILNAVFVGILPYPVADADVAVARRAFENEELAAG